MEYDKEQAIASLEKWFGYSSFRPSQEEIVKAVVEGHDVFVSMHAYRIRQVSMFSATVLNSRGVISRGIADDKLAKRPSSVHETTRNSGNMSAFRVVRTRIRRPSPDGQDR